MADVEQYMLTFDLSEITRNIAELQAAYDSMSASINKSSEEADKHLDNIQRKAASITTSLNASFQSLDAFSSGIISKLEKITSGFSELGKHSKAITKTIKKLENLDLTKAVSSSKGSTAADRIAAVAPGVDTTQLGAGGTAAGMAKAAKKSADDALKVAKEAVDEAEKTEKKITTISDRMKNMLARESKGAKRAMLGIAGKAGLGGAMGMLKGGGLIGSLMGLMIMGVEQKQRLGAEAGEMKNAAEAAGGLFEEGTKKGIKWMADFGEEAQKKFAIPRKEIQAIVSQVANVGIKIDDTLTGNSKNYEKVTNNAITSTLALDKYLNLASGSTMQNSIKLVENYGYSLNEAADQVLQVGFSAQQSGMNMQKFIGTVHSGAAALVQYQIDAEDVSEVLQGIQKQYKDMGIDPTKAGTMAADVTSGVADKIMNLPLWAEIKLGERLFKKEGAMGIEARNKLKDIVIEGSPDKRANLMMEAMSFMRESVSGIQGENEQRLGLEKQFGLDPNQSKMVMSFMPKLAGMRAKGKIDPREVKEFMNAFKTEGQQLTELQKAQYDLVMGLSKIGEGLLEIVAGILGTLIVGFKSLPALFKALMTPDLAERDALYSAVSDAMEVQFKVVGSGVNRIKEGLSQMKEGTLAGIQAMADNILLAVNSDPGGAFEGMIDKIKENTANIANIAAREESRNQYLNEMDNVINTFAADVMDKITGGPTSASDWLRDLSKSNLDAHQSRLENERESRTGMTRRASGPPTAGQGSNQGTSEMPRSMQVTTSIGVNDYSNLKEAEKERP